MGSTITWLGHSNFFIEAPGVNIYIDPFFGAKADERPWRELPPADIVLVTHDHGDHAGSALDICLEQGAMLGCIVEAVKSITQGKLPPELILNGVGFNMGGAVSHKDAKALMIPAFHSGGNAPAAGYIITLPDGATIYHAGDTCLFGDMALWGELYPLDIALLPIGGVFTMDPTQAARACKLLGAAQVIPMHWGSFPVLEQNTAKFTAALADLDPACKPLLLSPGEVCYLPGAKQPARPGRT